MEAAKPTENKTDAMNDSIIAFKAHKQLKRFLGRFSPHFHKPTVQFIGQALYGIQASGDVKLASWVRMLDEGISAKKVEDRLSRNLSLEGMDRKIQQIVMDDSRGFVKKDTLIVIDPTDICKENARKMQYLYKVRDGSRSKENGDPLLVNGYTGCMAIACNSGNRRIVPLHFSLWSTIAPDYHSENTELGHILDQIRSVHGTNGIYVYDRGGDNIELFRYFARHGLDFIVRLKRRNLVSWKGIWDSETLAAQVTMSHRATVRFDSHGRETKVPIQFGAIPVELPDIPDVPLHLVVVKGFGTHPMILLTSLAKESTYKSLWQVVEGYLSRWRVEDTIRYIKQAYNLEDVRLMKYTKLKNMAALVLAVSYFAAAWLGHNVKAEILVEHLTRMSRQICETPDFHYYALAAGLKMAFMRHGRWSRVTDDWKSPQLELKLAWG